MANARAVTTTRLAETRVRSGLTQAQLAVATGLSVSTLQRLEANSMKPLLWHVVNIALVLDCAVEDLCEDEWLSWRPAEAWPADRPRNPATGEPRSQVRAELVSVRAT
jgi:DNA-binding XRE family transcriptional regulator